MHSISCRSSGEMHELHPLEKGMQFLSSRSAAATRHAIESFVQVINGYENRIRVIFSSDPERSSNGCGIPPTVSATWDAFRSEHAASRSENVRGRCLPCRCEA